MGILKVEQSTNGAELMTASQPLHQTTQLLSREKEKANRNLLMRLVVGGTTLIVTFGV